MSQTTWSRQVRNRFNKRHSIIQEIQRWADLHNNGRLADAARELDDVLVANRTQLGKFSFTEHLQERRKNNPNVREREREARQNRPARAPRPQQPQQPRRQTQQRIQQQRNQAQQPTENINYRGNNRQMTEEEIREMQRRVTQGAAKAT